MTAKRPLVHSGGSFVELPNSDSVRLGEQAIAAGATSPDPGGKVIVWSTVENAWMGWDGSTWSLLVLGAGIFPLTCAAIGDSRVANNLKDQSVGARTVINWSTQGALFWFNFLTYQAFDLPYGNIKAASGATTAAIAAQVPSVLALTTRPRFCFIGGGTNSFSATSTYAQVLASFADITGAATTLRSYNIEPVIEVDIPRTVASWTANAAKCSIQYNKLIRAWCQANGVRCVDSEAVYVQISGGTPGDPVTGYNVADGIHSSATGGIIRGLAFQAAMADVLPAFGQQTSNPLDVFDATYNPTGNLLTTGLFTGTGGSNSGTGASGSVSTSWTNQVVSGTCTCVASKENPRADGRIGDAQVQTISTTTASVTRLSQSGNVTTTGKLVAGDVVVGEVDCELSAISGTVEYAQLNLTDFDGATNGGTSLAGKNTFAAGLNPLPTLPLAKNTTGNWLTTLRGRLRTAPVTISQNITSTTLLYRLETSLGASSGLTVKWGDATLRKV